MAIRFSSLKDSILVILYDYMLTSDHEGFWFSISAIQEALPPETSGAFIQRALDGLIVDKLVEQGGSDITKKDLFALTEQGINVAENLIEERGIKVEEYEPARILSRLHEPDKHASVSQGIADLKTAIEKSNSFDAELNGNGDLVEGEIAAASTLMSAQRVRVSKAVASSPAFVGDDVYQSNHRRTRETTYRNSTWFGSLMDNPIKITSILGAVTMAFASPAAAQEPAWTVTPPSNGSAMMTRTLENITLAYKRTPDDDDHLHITVGNCGSSPWEMDESLNGVTAKSLRDSVAEEIDNAKLNCKLAEGVEDRLMAGLDEAFARVKPFAAPHRATVGGWQLSDEGSLPGDDSERVPSMTKALATVTMTYQPTGTSDGASIQLKCEGANYGGGFDFGNPPEDHLKVINGEMAEDYADFAKDCKGKPEALAVVMQDFPQALATLEGWLEAKPFVYPPDNSSKQ